MNSQVLLYVGFALLGWVVRHKLPPASVIPAPAVAPAAAAGGNPFAGQHPALTALLTQGESVIGAALQDWLANGMPAKFAPAASAAQHPLLAAANQVAAQAGQGASAQVLAQLQQSLQAAAATKAA